MSLFGSSPTEESPVMSTSDFQRSRSSLFEDEPAMTKSTSSALFQDDDSAAPSPWDLPTPRKQLSRADLIRNLLSPADVPDSYVETFDALLGEHDDAGGRISSAGITRALAAARLGADEQAQINSIIAPAGENTDGSLGRPEFNVFLALVGLAQQGETISLDSVDEHRRSESPPETKL